MVEVNIIQLVWDLGNNVLTTSTEGEGTTVKIVFPIGSFTNQMIGDVNYGFKGKEQ